MDCPNSDANNRQTWMLADIKTIGCSYLKSLTVTEREHILLEKAKENLLGLSFFALKEYPSKNKLLFEKTFNVEFGEEFEVLKSQYENYKGRFTETQKKQILSLNKLDVKLYKFAKYVYMKRFQQLNAN